MNTHLSYLVKFLIVQSMFALIKECIHNPVPQRVYFPIQVPLVLLVNLECRWLICPRVNPVLSSIVFISSGCRLRLSSPTYFLHCIVLGGLMFQTNNCCLFILSISTFLWCEDIQYLTHPYISLLNSSEWIRSNDQKNHLKTILLSCWWYYCHWIFLLDLIGERVNRFAHKWTQT